MALSITHFCFYVLLTLLASSSTAKAQEWSLTLGGHSSHGQVALRVGSQRSVTRHHSQGRGHGRYRARPGRVFRQAARRHRHGPTCRVVGGVYEQRPHEVWVPGFERRLWVPARYEYHEGWRATRRHLVRAGYWRTVHEPGHYETRYRSVWVPRRYVCTSGGISAFRR